MTPRPSMNPLDSCNYIIILGGEEGDTTPEYQPPDIGDMDIKPMMKTKDEYR